MESANGQAQPKPGQNIFRIIWAGWLKFTVILGTVQMIIVLTIIYWVMVPMIAIPFKLFADPLALSRRNGTRWIRRDTVDNTLDGLKNQF